MTALAEGRNTKRRDGVLYHYPVAAAVTCYEGGIACLDLSGNCLPAVAAAGNTANRYTVGVFQERAANAGAAGAMRVTVATGIFHFAYSGTPSTALIGLYAYALDDQTVIADDNGSGTRPGVGLIVDADAAGVWVAIRA